MFIRQITYEPAMVVGSFIVIGVLNIKNSMRMYASQQYLYSVK